MSEMHNNISIQELIDLLKELMECEGKHDISEEMSLVNDLGMSSFDVLILVCEIEKKFNINLALTEYQEIVSVKDLYDYVIKNSTKAVGDV